MIQAGKQALDIEKPNSALTPLEQGVSMTRIGSRGARREVLEFVGVKAFGSVDFIDREGHFAGVIEGQSGKMPKTRIR